MNLNQCVLGLITLKSNRINSFGSININVIHILGVIFMSTNLLFGTNPYNYLNFPYNLDPKPIVNSYQTNYVYSKAYLSTFDFDEDGIPDDIDLDDDNDGILDVDEEGCQITDEFSDLVGEKLTSYNNIINTNLQGDSEKIEFRYTSNGQYPTSTAHTWLTYEDANSFGTIFNIGKSGEVKTWTTELNTPNGYFVTGYMDFTFGGDDAWRNWKVFNGQLSVTLPDGVTAEIIEGSNDIYTNYENGDTYQSDNKIYLTATNTSRVNQKNAKIRIYFHEVSSPVLIFKFFDSNGGISYISSQHQLGFNFISNLQLCQNQDSDNDGIENKFDLDSDNDGCSDAYESGATDDPNVQQFSGDVGDNGFLNSLETNDTPNLNYNFTPTLKYVKYNTLNACSDFDGDGIGDLVDLDDDNDGIPDIIESPNCFADPNDFESNIREGDRRDILEITSQVSLNNGTVEGFIDGLETNINRFTIDDITNKSIFKIVFNEKRYIEVFVLTVDNTYSFFQNGAIAKLQAYDNGQWIDLSEPITYDASSDLYGNKNAEIFTITKNWGNYKSYRLLGVSGSSIYNTWIHELLIQEKFNAQAHPLTNCTDDTDGDGILNHLDLDSDGDGCFDIKEAGIITNNSDSLVVGPFGNNGLSNQLETDDTEFAELKNKIFYTDFALSEYYNACIDFDGDGIADLIDLDDDNDGIPDIQESNCEFLPYDLSLLSFDHSNIDINYKENRDLEIISSTASWQTTYSDKLFDLPISMSFKANDVGGIMIGFIGESANKTVNNWNDGGLKFYLTGATAYGKFPTAWNTTDTGLPSSYTAKIEIDENGYLKAFINDNLVFEQQFTNEKYQISISHNVNKTLQNFKLYTTESALICTDFDTDGDGIPNRHDLDSDGDGCFDSYESHTSTNANDSILPGPFGSNGLANNLENTDNFDAILLNENLYEENAISAFLNACIDTDGDGIGDLIDLDDDNDGVLDEFETCEPVSQTLKFTIDQELSVPNKIVYSAVRANGTKEYIYTEAPATHPGLMGDPQGARLRLDGSIYLDDRGMDGVTINETVITFRSTIPLKSILFTDCADFDGGVGDLPLDALAMSIPGTWTTPDNTEFASYDVNTGNLVNNNSVTGAIASLSAMGAGNNIFLQRGAKSDIAMRPIAGTTGPDMADPTWRRPNPNQTSGDLLLFTAENKFTECFLLYEDVANNGTREFIHASFYLYALEVELYDCILDTDGDGIINSLDLDSDNDGCPDGVEAGVLLLGDSLISGSVGANGFADNLETDTESGITNTIVVYSNAIDFEENCDDCDGDGIINVVDLDDDNDGILDSIEDPDGTGADFDGDGLPNTCDLDSDNDGCYDGVEAGALLLGDSLISGSVGNNGLADNLEIVIDSGQIIYIPKYHYAIDGNSICDDGDCDGDLVLNIYDLDDDNDGIPDSIEKTFCYLDTGWVETPNSKPYVWADIPAAAGNSFVGTVKRGKETVNITVTADFPFGYTYGLWGYNQYASGILAPNGLTDRPSARTNWKNGGAMTVTFSKPVQDPILGFISLGNGGYTMRLEFDKNTQLVAETSALGGNTYYANGKLYGTESFALIKFPGVHSSIKVYSYGTEGYTNLAYGIKRVANDFELTTIEKCYDEDFDGDGLPNTCDLDSDNDGCPDGVESGTVPLGDSIVPGPYGPNGLANSLETGEESGVLNIPITYEYAQDSTFEICEDCDGDGIVNFFDLDDDNDGIPDVIEDPEGLNLDADGDGLPNTCDLDSDNDGCPDAYEGGANRDTLNKYMETFDGPYGNNGLVNSLESEDNEFAGINYKSTYSSFAKNENLSKCEISEDCSNGIDDDGDGLVDCFDPKCNCGHEDECSGVGPSLPFNIKLKYQTSGVSVEQRSGVFAGDLDGDGKVELVASNSTHLLVFDGENGSLLKTFASAHNPFAYNALADTDRDGIGEIYTMTGRYMKRFDYDKPNYVWMTPLLSQGQGTIEVADFDGDGIPELYTGDDIVDSKTGEIIFLRNGTYIGTEPNSIAINIFNPGDPKPKGGIFGKEANGLELVVGNKIYVIYKNANSNTFIRKNISSISSADGRVSVGDVDGDSKVDIIVNSPYQLYVWNPRTQKLIGSPYPFNAGGRMLVGDFDHDGRVEFGAPDYYNYNLFRYDENLDKIVLVWANTVKDYSSGRTSSTFFDFDGNGTDEIIYSDENFLFVWDAITGEEIGKIASAAGTRYEYPITVDIDGDGHAEIITTSQNTAGPGYSPNGYIKVFESNGNPWEPSRKVWNQHGYHVFNVNDDLTIPSDYSDQWGQEYFNGKYNVFLGQRSFSIASNRIPLPDVALTFLGSSNPFQVRIENIGDATFPTNMPITIYDGDPRSVNSNVIKTIYTEEKILVGDQIIVEFDLSNPPEFIYAVVNDNGSINRPYKISDALPTTSTEECDYENNINSFEVSDNFEIKGFAFFDCDQDGIYANGEDLIPNVIVYLTGVSVDGVSVSLQTTTNVTGAYKFDDVKEGNYEIDFSLPDSFDGITVTIQDQGSDDDIDCDANNQEKIILTSLVNINLMSIGYTDTVAPVIKLLDIATEIECDEEVPGAEGVKATDNYDENPVLTHKDTIINGENCVNEVIRTWTAIDECGNQSTAEQKIQIVDNTPPVMEGGADLALYCGDNLSKNLADWINNNAGILANDLCNEVDIYSNFQNDNGGFCGEKIPVTFFAEDACGNKSERVFYYEKLDTTPPVIPVPIDVTLSCDTQLDSLNLVAQDACDGELATTLTIEKIGEFCGSIIRTWTAVDNCRNEASASQTITIIDETKPVFTNIPDDVIVDVEAGETIPDWPSDVEVTDNCSENLEILTDDEEHPKGCGYEITRKWSATDDCGNLAEKTQIIQVLGQLTIEIEADDIAQCESNQGEVRSIIQGGVAPFTYEWSSSDLTIIENGLPNIQVESTVAGSFMVNLNVSDVNGCLGSATVQVKVFENFEAEIQGDTVYCEYNTIQLRASAGSSWLWTLPDGSTQNTQVLQVDNCTLSHKGLYTLLVSDESGCQVEITQKITVFRSITFNTSSNAPVCQYGNLDLFVSGNSQYDYLWTGPNGWTSTEQNPKIDELDLEPGIYRYTIHIESDFGCTGDGYIDIDVNQGNQVVLPSDTLLCKGEDLAVIVDGGTDYFIVGPNNYISFNNEISLSNTNADNSGIYSISTTTESGCVYNDEVSIMVLDGNLEIEGASPICAGEMLTLGTALNAGKYNWTGPDNFSSDIQFPEIDSMISAKAGTYQLTIATLDERCSLTTEKIIEVQGEMSDVTLEIEGESCENLGTISLTGVDIDDEFDWSDLEEVVEPMNRTSLKSGVYALTITKSTGCEVVFDSIVIEDNCPCPNPPVVTNVTTENANCGNEDGTVLIELEGYASEFIYEWYPDVGKKNGQFLNSKANLPAGDYELKISRFDNENCFTSIFVTIEETSGVNAEIESQIAANCSLSNGTVNLIPDNYTYLWSDDKTGANRIDLAAGDYTVTCTSEEGCSSILEITVDKSSSLVAFAEILQQPTCGEENGSVKINVEEGAGVYTYSWGAFDTKNDLGGGVYDITVTDDQSGCETVVEFTLLSTGASAEINILSDLQLACDEVSIDLIFEIEKEVGFIEPSQEVLLNEQGDTLENFQLGLGSYCLQVYDNNGCLKQENCFEVIAPNEFQVGSIYDDKTCANKGMVRLEIEGGKAPYTFAWSDGNTDAERLDLDAGTYEVTVSDAANCQKELAFTILNNCIDCELPTYELSSTNPDCQMANGTISIANLNTGKYNILWDDNSISNLRTDLMVGAYYLTISDKENEDCYKYDTIILKNEGIVDITISEQTMASCMDDGSIVLLPENFNYIWADGQTGNTRADLSAKTYTVFATTDEGCATSISFTIEKDCNIDQCVEPIISNTEIINADCNKNNGLIAISLEETENYSFVWEDGSTENTRTNLYTGVYTLTISYDLVDGCEIYREISIGNKESTQVEIISQIAETCLENDGSVVLGPETLDFVWEDGTTGNTRTGLTAGNYTVMATNPDGCVNNFELTVVKICEEIPCVLPEIVSRNIEKPNCQTSDGSIEIILSEPDSLFSFEWNTGKESTTLADLNIGIYTVTITRKGEENCQIIDTIALENQGGTSLEIVTNQGETCEGNDGHVKLGPANVIFNWEDGFVGAERSDLVQGVYNVAGFDLNGCVTGISFTVENDCDDCNEPLFTSEITFPDCKEENGQITLDLAENQAVFDITWSNGSQGINCTNLDIGNYTVTVSRKNMPTCQTIKIFSLDGYLPVDLSVIASESASCLKNDGYVALGPDDYQMTWGDGFIGNIRSDLTPGSYTVQGSNTKGCTGEITFDIDLNCTDTTDCTLPVIAQKLVTEPACQQQDGAIEITLKNPSDYIFNWSIGATENKIENLDLGVYYVTITQKGNPSCSLIDTTEINNNLDTHIEILTKNDETCDLDDGYILVGPANFTYFWTDGVVGKERTDLGTATYKVFGTNQEGCIASMEIEIGFDCDTTCNLPIVVDTNWVQPSCNASDGSITLVFEEDLSNYEVIWENGFVGNTLDNIPAGNYSYLIQHKTILGCQISGSISLIQSDNININYTTTSETCEVGGSISFEDENQNITWENGLFGSQSDMDAGIYKITVEKDGCEQSLTIEIPSDCPILDCAPKLLLDNIENPDCNGQNGSIELTMFGSNQDYDFSWSNAATTDHIVDLQSGYYAVTITRKSNPLCQSVFDFVVNENGGVPIAIESMYAPSCNQADGQIVLAPTGENYIWSDGGTGSTRSDLQVGDYLVTLTKTDGCQSLLKVTMVDVCTGCTTSKTELGIQSVPCLDDQYLFCTDRNVLELSSLQIRLNNEKYDGEIDVCNTNQYAIYLDQGLQTIEFIDLDTYCIDTVQLEVTCNGSKPKQDTVEIIIPVGEDSIYCFDDITGTISILEDCSTEIDINEITIAGTNCIDITAFEYGEQDLCIENCDEFGNCDTIYVHLLQVTDDNPIAIDNDTLSAFGNTLNIDVLANDNINGNLTGVGIIKHPKYGEAIWKDGKIEYDVEGNCGETDEFTYYISNENGSDTATVLIEILCDKIYVYNGFSPNGDQLNDQFFILNIDSYPNNRVEVYNRWGNLVYGKDHYKNDSGWDGTIDGKPVPSGTYFYVISINKEENPIVGYLQVN